MAPRRYTFPAGFLWGSATAAYQIEGATREDGRGDSIWDAFCRRPGAVADGSSGDEACRHYHRWREDLDLVRDLGHRAYRFSVAWPRIQPLGSGAFNPLGLDFYERLVDGMLERGISPNCTLYHWDLPTPLEERGGWLERDTALRFADYADAVARRLGDRVDLWATFNEANVFTSLGYERGLQAPARREGAQAYRQVIHHVLLAHFRGIRALRARMRRPGARAGIVLSPVAVWPQDARPATLEACERRWSAEVDWWMLPLTEGRYPEGPWSDLEAQGAAPEVRPGEFGSLFAPMDYIGLNYYNPSRTAEDPHDPRGWTHVPRPPQSPRQDMPGWEVFAPALRSQLLRAHRRYHLPIYVTENGMGLKGEEPGPDGIVHDARRVDYMRRHLAEISRAISEGADVRGYFHWSLMDNFEWAFGYTLRFGMVHVDYATYRRTPKDSARWYRDCIREGGFEADLEDQPAPPGWVQEGK